LQIKGIEQKLSLAFDWQPQEEKALLSGEAELSRLAFQIGSGEWSDTTSIADEVLVRFSLTLVQAPR
jgi:polyisoprenoid-binding protein YceI